MTMLSRCWICLLIVLVCSGGVLSATLDDYQKRVEAVKLDVIALRRLEDEGSAFDEMRRRKLDEIGHSLPISEQVQWRGGEVETNNRWLHDAISSYTSEHDAQRRKTQLFAIEQRLQAIAEKIDETKIAESAERTKDEDKQKLGEILRRPEFQKPEVKEESLFQRWYRAFMEWLEKVFPQAPKAPPGTASGFGSLKLILQVLIFAIVIGLIGLLLYKFRALIPTRFGKKRTKKGDRVILGEHIAADESSADLFSEAERLAHAGQLREAIRKGYIAALCELADRRIVRLAQHKTNRDYLRDVRKTRAGLFETMSGLTGTYERNWYGLRTSGTSDWEEFKVQYRQTMSQN
jgi:hypothetical protein